MSDHRIGISVDTRDNGGVKQLQRNFQDIARTAQDLQKQFQSVDKSISQLVTKGWGSENYTRSLRDQLNTLRQMSQLLERQSRINGNEGARNTASQISQEIRRSMGDLGAVSTVPTAGDYARRGMGTFGKWAGRAAVAYAGYQGFNAIRGGYNAALQQNYTLADIAKTMAPGGGNEAWAYNMLGAGQGYAYSNQQLLSGIPTIKAAVGNNPNFFQQIQGVAQFGRQYGFDYNQAAQYFANSYQNGVTGGQGAQMSWQQYAILVANTVQQANMQGREGQVVSTLQQLTGQLSAQNMSAPNQQAMAGMYATAAKTGNQNLINNFGSIMGAINSGIQSPGMGPMGQAAMWQAVAPGKDYWQAQYIESQGGTPQNIQGMLQYAYNNFGGTSYQAADMLASWIPGMTSSQAMTMLQTYMKTGTFQSASPSPTKKPKNAPPTMSPMDKTNQGYTGKDQNLQSFGSNFLGFFGGLYNDLFGNPTSAAITATATPVATAAAKYAGKKVIQKVASRTAASAASTAADSVAGATATDGALGLGSLGLFALPVAGLGAMAWAGNSTATPAQQSASNAAAQYLQRQQAWLAQHPGTYGPSWAPGQANSMPAANDPNAPWNKGLPHFATGGLVNRPTVAMVGEDGPEMIVPLRGGVANNRSNPMQEAPKIVATLFALRPWKDQINSIFAGPTSASNSSTSQLTQAAQAAFSSALTSQLAATGGANLPNVNYSDPYSNAPASNSYSGSGSKSFVNQFKPIALQVAKSLNIPSQYQNTFAEFALSQWAGESGWGTSQDAKGDDNFAGIKWRPGMVGTAGQSAADGGNYAHYSSLQQFANGYAQFLQGSNYSSFLNAARSGASMQQLMQIMAGGPYATAGSSSYMSMLNGTLPGVMANYGSAPSSMGQPSTKVQITAPKTIKVQLTNAGGNVVGESLLQLATQATYNGLKTVESDLSKAKNYVANMFK